MGPVTATSGGATTADVTKTATRGPCPTGRRQVASQRGPFSVAAPRATPVVVGREPSRGHAPAKFTSGLVCPEGLAPVLGGPRVGGPAGTTPGSLRGHWRLTPPSQPLKGESWSLRFLPSFSTSPGTAVPDDEIRFPRNVDVSPPSSRVLGLTVRLHSTGPGWPLRRAGVVREPVNTTLPGTGAVEVGFCLSSVLKTVSPLSRPPADTRIPLSPNQSPSTTFPDTVVPGPVRKDARRRAPVESSPKHHQNPRPSDSVGVLLRAPHSRSEESRVRLRRGRSAGLLGLFFGEGHPQALRDVDWTVLPPPLPRPRKGPTAWGFRVTSWVTATGETGGRWGLVLECRGFAGRWA